MMVETNSTLLPLNFPSSNSFVACSSIISMFVITHKDFRCQGIALDLYYIKKESESLKNRQSARNSEKKILNKPDFQDYKMWNI